MTREKISTDDVRAQLARILASPHFRTSKRCVALLEYITGRTLEGQTEGLKERSLGVEVFGRDSGYDTSQDPVVRYTAGEVRKRLAQYYQQAGHEREIRIQLSPGSYVPEFLPPQEQAAASSPGMGRARRTVMAASLAAVVLVAGAWWLHPWHRTSIIDRFWEPVVSDTGPVLISVGTARVFGFMEPYRSEVQPGAEAAFQAGRPVPELAPPLARNLLPLWGHYVCIADSACMVNLASFLRQRGKACRVRSGTATTLADLRDGPAILIGAFTNEWTLHLMEGLRFTFEFDAKRNIGYIRDRTRPQDRRWQVEDSWPDPNRWTDYGLVSRIRHPSTGRVILTAVGVDRIASMAAGELLTSPDHLSEALRNAPPGWEAKNIQLVFSTQVVGDDAGPPITVAVHVW